LCWYCGDLGRRRSVWKFETKRVAGSPERENRPTHKKFQKKDQNLLRWGFSGNSHELYIKKVAAGPTKNTLFCESVYKSEREGGLGRKPWGATGHTSKGFAGSL